MTIQSETERQVLAEGWAQAQSMRIARRIFDNQPYTGEVDRFERATLMQACVTAATREGVRVGQVVWEYAAGIRS